MRRIGCVGIVVACLTAFEACSSVEATDVFDVRGDVLAKCSADFEGVIVIPPRVKHIGCFAFSGCKHVTGFLCPDSLQTVGESAFSGCSCLSEVVLPISVTNIGPRAFQLCGSLTNAVIRAKIDRIPEELFDRCVNLRRTELPGGLLEVGDRAFAKCRSLDGIVLPESVTNIANSAFFSCSRLERVVLSENLIDIGDDAFGRCYDLGCLVLPKRIQSIGRGAFEDNVALVGIVLLGNVPRAESGLMRDVSSFFSLYSTCGRLQVRNNSEEWTAGFPVVECRTVDEAFLACKKNRFSELDEYFQGLRRVLRLAVDGFSMRDKGKNVDLLKMDEFAAHLFELRLGMPKVRVLGYAQKRARTFAAFSVGKNMTGVSAHFGVYNGNRVSLEMDLEAGALVDITMSAGLKEGVWLGLKSRSEPPNEIDSRWLRQE